MSLTKYMELGAGAESRTHTDLTAKGHPSFGKPRKQPKPHQPRVPLRARVLEFCSNVLGLDIPILCQWARNTLAQSKSAREEEATQLVKKLQKDLRKIAKSQNKKPTREGQQKMRFLKLGISEAQDKLREAEIYTKAEDIDQQITKLEAELKDLMAQVLSLKNKPVLSTRDKSARASLLRDLQVRKTAYVQLLKQRESLQPRVSGDKQPQVHSVDNTQEDGQVHSEDNTQEDGQVHSEDNTQEDGQVHSEDNTQEDGQVHSVDNTLEGGLQDAILDTESFNSLESQQPSAQDDVEEFIINSPLNVAPGACCHYSYHACGEDCEGIDLPAFSQPGAVGQTRDQIAMKVSLMHMAATGVLNDTLTKVMHDADLKWRVDVEGRAVVMHHGPYTDLVLAKNQQGQARPVLLIRKHCQKDSSQDDLIVNVLKQFASEDHSRGCVGVAFLEGSERYHHTALVLKANYTPK